MFTQGITKCNEWLSCGFENSSCDWDLIWFGDSQLQLPELLFVLSYVSSPTQVKSSCAGTADTGRGLTFCSQHLRPNLYQPHACSCYLHLKQG